MYYRLTNQSLGDKKALTVLETGAGILLRINTVYEKSSVSQTWVIMYADDEMQATGGYTLVCITPMSYLTYKRGKFILDYHEKTQPNQIWRFEK